MTTDFMRQVDERAQAALASGDLQPLVTEHVELLDGGLRFGARSVSTLAGKSTLIPGGPRDPNFNPFASPDPALTVGPLGEGHTAILNKFPVSERHLVIATREFKEQLSPLEADDFAALARVLGPSGGLGFYNGGAPAGASQRHKHLQWIPRAESNASLDLWLPGLPAGAAPLVTARHPQLGARHVFVRVGEVAGLSPEQAGAQIHAAYVAALKELGLTPDGDGLLPPFNLLIADGWLLLVPRSREHFEGLSVNALAYGGSFYAQQAEQLAGMRAAGPLAALAAVGT